MSLSWDDYRRWLGPLWTEPASPPMPPPALAAISTDSRSIRPGEWFIPLVGESFDGHRFVGEALARGASGFFYAAKRHGEFDAVALARGVAVSDPLAAYQKAASGWRLSLPSVKVLAMTGSTGKTTTKEMLGGILRQGGETLATQASFNNEVGVPKTLALLTPAHRYAAVEMGARHPGNIAFLCDLVFPDVAALINVGITHLGEFGSVENLLNTKLEIFRNSPERAICVAAYDDERIVRGARATGKRLLTFGRGAGADIKITAETWNADGSMSLALDTPSGRVDTRLGIAHAAFPINAAAACAMALAAGLGPEHVGRGLDGFAGIKGRFQVHTNRGLTIIDDTYNANPDSVRAGLSTLMRSFGDLSKVIILGDMLELGERSDEEHREVGAFCARVAKPELLVAVGQSASHLLAGARAEGLPAAKTRAFATVDDLLAERLPFASLGGILYAKGSNSIRLARVVEELLT